MPADIITVQELKTAYGIAAGDVDAVRDARYQQAIDGASAAVSAYADRNFASPLVTEQRAFEYDGSGFVEIDDCSAIQAVTYSLGGYDQVIQQSQWRAEPYGTPTFTYLALPRFGPGFSPAMGFMQNLDVIYREGGFIGVGPTVKVDATWGWPIAPDDVKRAVIWTAVAMADNLEPYVSESIAGYSHTSAIRGLSVEAIPERARDLLEPYLRLKVG